MKLKPGLFQLIVVIMILSLVTACGGNPNQQADCNNQSEALPTNSQGVKTANKQLNDCQPNSSSSSSRSTGNRFRSSGGSSSFSSGNSGDSSSSSGKGRGGFGSFGRGGSGGG